MKKTLSFLLLFAMVFCLLTWGGGALAADDTITLVFSVHEANNASICTDVLQPWFERIETESEGRVRIEAHYNGELASPNDAYDEVFKGNIDMAFIMQSTMPQCIGDQIIDASFIENNSVHMSRIYNELYDKYEQMHEPYAGVKVLLLFCMYPNAIGSNKEIGSAADMKGLKMIASDAFQSARLEALGATAVSCLPPDVYSTLEKGVADGATVVSIPQLISNSWGEVVHYIYDVPLRHPTNGIIMNLDTWNSLPEDIQELIDGMQADIVELADTAMVAAQEAAKEEVPELYGTVVVEPDESFIADLNAAWEPVHEQWLADYESSGFPANELYADMISLVEQYG